MWSRVVQSAIGQAGSQVDRLFVRATFKSGRASKKARKSYPPKPVAGLAEATAFYAAALAAGRLFPEPPPIAECSEKRVRRLPGGTVVDAAWPSPYVPLHQEAARFFAQHPNNARTRARWYRHDAPAATLVCLNGWGGGHFRFEAFMYRPRWFYDRGLDVILFPLPFHGPRGAGLSMPRFPSPNGFRTNEGLAQAILELRGLVRRLRARGAPAVGLSGMSLGGFVSALYATVEDDVDFVVPVMPVASLAEMMWRGGSCGDAQRRAVERGITQETLRQAFSATAPLLREPKVPAERFLVVAAEHDRVVPADHARRLSAHFDCPELATFPGSHLVHVGKEHLLRSLLGMSRRRR